MIWHVVLLNYLSNENTKISVCFFVDRKVFKKVHLGHTYWFEISNMKIICKYGPLKTVTLLVIYPQGKGRLQW